MNKLEFGFNDVKRFIGGVLIIVFSNVLGHYFPPSLYFITPITLPFAILLFFEIKVKKIGKSLLASFGVILHDLLIKTIAVGNNDSESLGWIILFTMPSIIISFFILSYHLVKDFKRSYVISLIGFLIFPSTLYLYYTVLILILRK